MCLSGQSETKNSHDNVSLADELRTYSSDRFKLALKTFLFATY